jgi:SAM-dependent methyltransferase
VLDCGAAFGALMDVAAEAGFEAYGIELVADAADAIARRFGPERVFSGQFEQAAFPCVGDNGFDCVFMCDFIEHVRDPQAVLRRASSLLKPGGWIVLTTPDTDSLSCRLMGAGWPLYDVEHLYCFNRRNLGLLLKRAGLTATGSGCARKVVDLAYIRDQLNARPRPLVTPAINLVARCAGCLRNRQVSFSLGQMIVVGTKL